MINKWRTGQKLVMINETQRRQAPPYRDRLTIVNVRTDGWVDVKYDDGWFDCLTYSKLEDHWGESPGQNTPLWKVLNAR